jgi:hypothetical protein
MRVRIVALSALTLALGLVGGTAAQATQYTSLSAATTPQVKAAGADTQRAKLQPVFLEAKLEGRNEVPVPGKPPVGDPKGSATGIIKVQGDRVTFAFSWTGISAPTLGHIHQGDTGVNGDVKVPLFGTPMPANVTAAAGAATVSDPAIADALRTNPSGFYLNLHTKEFPGGAVRGQLAKLPRGVDLLGLLQGGGEKAFLSGDQEVPTPNGPAVGDRNGLAVSFIRPKGTNIDFAFAWIGIQPTLGHIHKAPFGVNGPVAVPIFATAVPSTVFAVSGTVTSLDPALVSSIATNPSAFYTNLHTAKFPGGAVRGQLFNES